MFSKTFRNTAFAAVVATAATIAASAAFAGQAQQTSSAVWWSAAGNHADLVISYDSRATVPLKVNVVYVLDVGGLGVSQTNYGCGIGNKTGDTVTSHTLAPGQNCFIRAFRGTGQSEIVGKVIISDATSNNANIQQFVRTSLETRDASDNVLTHVEVR